MLSLHNIYYNILLESATCFDLYRAIIRSKRNSVNYGNFISFSSGIPLSAGGGMWVYGLDWAGPGYRQVAEACECGSEPSGSVKCGKFLD